MPPNEPDEVVNRRIGVFVELVFVFLDFNFYDKKFFKMKNKMNCEVKTRLTIISKFLLKIKNSIKRWSFILQKVKLIFLT